MWGLRSIQPDQEIIGETIYCKLVEKQNSRVLACCDKELLGQTLTQGKIHFEVRESFYKGQAVSEEKFRGLLKQASNINLVGEKCVGLALKEGYLNQNDIIKIQGIPHALIFKL